MNTRFKCHDFMSRKLKDWVMADSEVKVSLEDISGSKLSVFLSEQWNVETLMSFGIMLWCQGNQLPDTKWSWVVCFAAAINNLLQFGFSQSFGVFLPVLSEHFQEGREPTAWAGSIALGFTMFAGPFAVKLTEKFGQRAVAIGAGLGCTSSLLTSSFVNHLIILYFSYGVLFGLCGGSILNTGYTVTTKYFKEKRALATGITNSGISIGVMTLGPVIEQLVEAMGWRNTLRVMAGIMLLICLLASTYDPIQVENEEERPQQQRKGCLSVVDCSVYRNLSYTIGVITITLAFFGLYVPLIHLVRFAKDLGISSKDASFLFTVIGISSTIARIVIGQIIDKKWLTALQVVQLCAFVMGLSIIFSAFAKEYSHLVIFAVVYGNTSGGFITGQSVFLQNTLEPEKSASGLGMGYMVYSVAVCGGPPLAGFLADDLGTYIISFYTIGGIVVLSSALPFILLCPCFSKLKRAKHFEIAEMFPKEKNASHKNDTLHITTV